MKRKVSVWVLVFAVLFTASTTFNITYLTAWYRFGRTGASVGDKLGEIQSYINEYYITDYDTALLSDGAAAGYVDALPDKWSRYMTVDEYTEYSDTTLDDYVGIGVQGVYEEDAEAIRVNEVYADGPAAKAGIRYFDLITAVNGETVASLGFDETIERIRGVAGTTVTITYVSALDGEEKTVEMVRAEVKDTNLGYELLDDEIGYIRIKQFQENVDKQFIAAVEDLLAQGAKGIVFDVRMNPGGRLDVLRNMLDPLLPEGTIIENRDKSGAVRTLTSDANALDIPMAVIVNAYSYSAAEFFAASLQEYEQATVVGEKTTGKSYSQQTFPLSDGSALVLSTARYFTSKGVDLAQTGVTPDVEVPLTDEELYMLYYTPHTEDKQLMAAVDAVLDEINTQE